MKISVVIGNPSPRSRTSALAEGLADAIVAAIAIPDPDRAIIELADHGGSLFDWKSQTVTELNRQMAASDLIVVASPTYKAAYTGLLKAFLDRYDTNGLAGTVAIPVMTGGSSAHSLAPDVTLRPLLVELGASVPTRSLYFMTSQMDNMDAIIATWIDANRHALAGALSIGRAA